MKWNPLKAGLAVTVLCVQFGAFAQQKPVKSKMPYSDNLRYASQVGPNGFVRCGTMEADSIMRANNPGMPTLNQEEVWLQQAIESYKQEQALNPNAKKVVITIPVVVHVIHNGDNVGSNENIADGQVLSQITVMNQDFRRMMGTNGYNTHPDGADVEIEFCMAQIDPQGNPTTGINRVNYGQATFSGQNDANTMKQATIWDPTQYMNMWTVNYGNSGLLGFAQFPNNSGLGGLGNNNGNANTDGVVADYRSFGSSQLYPQGTYTAPYDLGRTMTHEVGHFLGLRHTWGDAFCGDDYCADVPETQSSNYGCPNNQTTCDGNVDMVENYMDYTNDACMNIFTEDQKTRMLTVMSVSPRRASLASSTVCNTSANPDDVGVSAIIAPDGNICGSTVVPEIEVTNYGNNTVTSFTLTYDIDGAGAQNYNWSGTLNAGASTTITLGSVSPSAGAHAYNASTSSPNGNTDTDATNDDASNSFTIVTGGQEITLTLNTDCFAEETVWQLIDASNNVIDMGGNQNVTLPVTAQQPTATTDPGAYPAETQIVVEWCLAEACYDFVIYDAYGDGMNGSQWQGCSTDGDYTITDAQGTVLASIQAANSDFQWSETNNFCLTPPCTAAFTTSTVEEDCAGDNDGSITVNFTSGNSTGATYDIGNGPQASNVFNNVTPGSYTITVVDGDGCTSTVQASLGGPSALNGSVSTVTDETNGNDGAININVSGGTSGYTYAWTGPGGFTASSQDISGLTGGTYSVTITDANGCTTTITNIVVDSSVGIDELENGEFVVYPNPSNGLFNVELIGNIEDNFTVTVLDVAGRVFLNQEYNSDAFVVNMENAANGSYTIVITTSKHTMMKRVIVK